MKRKYTPFKKGIFTGFGFPGIGMSSAMFGYGVFAAEAGLDLYLCLGSVLILWSMPGMVIFVSLFSNASKVPVDAPDGHMAEALLFFIKTSASIVGFPLLSNT